MLAARSAAKLEAIATDCRTAGAEALVVPTDAGEHASCRALIEAAARTFGGLDVLVDNVGVATLATLARAVDHGVFERVLRVNLLGGAAGLRNASGGRRAHASADAGGQRRPATRTTRRSPASAQVRRPG